MPSKLLDRERVDLLVEELREVIHARDDRHRAAPVLVLALLLHPGVEVTDDRKALDDRLAVELEQQTQDAVRRRVDRAHVDGHAVFGLVVGLDVRAVAPVLESLDDRVSRVVVTRFAPRRCGLPGRAGRPGAGSLRRWAPGPGALDLQERLRA